MYLLSFKRSSFIRYSSPGRAVDFGAADALYKERAQGQEAITKARAAYLTLQPLSEADELVYAAEQVARLDVYGALSISEAQIAKRKPILDSCLRDIEVIGPSGRASGSPEYLYWKVACRALWCEANGIMSSLSYASQLVKDIEKGIEMEPTYEGGGFDRAAGVIFMKLPWINPFGPRGDLKKSIRHFKASLEADAYPKSKNPETETGDYHYPTHYYFAQALIKDNRADDALQLLDDAVNRIKSGDMPVGREPETVLTLRLMETLRATLR